MFEYPAHGVLTVLYFMMPAYAANMAPPLVQFWKGWNPPISERWLGAHKTLLGVAAAVLAALIATMVQAANPPSVPLVDYRHWPWVGLGFGLGVAGGDILKSFIKRRIGIPPGARWMPFDQLDYAIGAVAVVGPCSELGAADVLLILLVSFFGNVVVNWGAFGLGIKKTCW